MKHYTDFPMLDGVALRVPTGSKAEAMVFRYLQAAVYKAFTSATGQTRKETSLVGTEPEKALEAIMAHEDKSLRSSSCWR